MDFFERQDKARKNTKLLVFYFAVAVLLIVASIYLVSLFVFHGAANYKHRGYAVEFSLWNPTLFFYAAGGTLAVIVCGSLFKTMQLSAGGSAVAESLGGRLVDVTTNDPDERKLLNVIEEMAIASGVPVPKVYVMDGEQGINAFAAGHNINDAAIGVTRGCITELKRDELQGVIGHEFSHILNGDMRINLRLMGIIFGIMCLAVIGRQLLNARSGDSRDRNILPLLGIVLLILGWVGVFFGQLIQAAVSRQREFLADASAVQFTRNPDGLSGALQKIGAAHHGSQIEDEHAAEASHMFFGNAMKNSLFNAFATHPPLEERIRAINPNWDGTFPEARGDDDEVEALLNQKSKARASAMPTIIPGLPGAAGAAAAIVIQTNSVMPNVGNPTPLHLRYAVELRESLPENIRDAARDPHGASALLYALLLSDDEGQRNAQLQELAKLTHATTHNQIVALWPEVSVIAQNARLPLVNLAIPALRQLGADGFNSFSQTLKWLVESDEQIVLFEFVLTKIIQRQVGSHFARTRPPTTQFYTIKPLAPDCERLLSALAHTGQRDPQDITKAFQTGVPFVRAGVPMVLLPQNACGLSEINESLDRLALAVPQIKKNLLEACVRVVGADGVIQENEAELLRGIAESLDCPLPPFVTETEVAA